MSCDSVLGGGATTWRYRSGARRDALFSCFMGYLSVVLAMAALLP